MQNENKYWALVSFCFSWIPKGKETFRTEAIDAAAEYTFYLHTISSPFRLPLFLMTRQEKVTAETVMRKKCDYRGFLFSEALHRVEKQEKEAENFKRIFLFSFPSTPSNHHLQLGKIIPLQSPREPSLLWECPVVNKWKQRW